MTAVEALERLEAITVANGTDKDYQAIDMAKEALKQHRPLRTPTAECPYPNLHGAGCTCHGEGGAR